MFGQEYRVELDRDVETGRIVMERWKNEHGKLDRPCDLPAMIHYCPETGKQTLARWYKNGFEHRDDDKPSSLGIDPETGVNFCESWAVNGLAHREGDQPSRIYKDGETGNITELQYKKNGVLHRRDAPAIQKFDVDTGQLLEEQFWVDGVRIQPRSSPLIKTWTP